MFTLLELLINPIEKTKTMENQVKPGFNRSTITSPESRFFRNREPVIVRVLLS